MKPTLQLVTAIMVVLCAATAAAQGAATVIGVDVHDGSPWAGQVNRALLDGAGQVGGLAVTDYTNVTLTDTLQLIGCSGADRACVRELASTLGTDVLVFGALGGANSPSLSLSIYDARQDATTVSRTFELPTDGLAQAVSVRISAWLNGRSVIRVSALDGGGEVYVDGVHMGRTPALVSVVPGEMSVRVEFDDGRRRSRNVEVPPLDEVAVELAPRGRAPRAAVAESGASGGSPVRTAGWVALGAGVAVAGLGGHFGARAQDAQGDFDRTSLQREAHDIAARGESDARSANALLVTGGVLAVGGVTAVILGRGRSDSVAARPAHLAIEPLRRGAAATLRLEL